MGKHWEGKWWEKFGKQENGERLGKKLKITLKEEIGKRLWKKETVINKERKRLEKIHFKILLVSYLKDSRHSPEQKGEYWYMVV